VAALSLSPRPRKTKAFEGFRNRTRFRNPSHTVVLGGLGEGGGWHRQVLELRSSGCDGHEMPKPSPQNAKNRLEPGQENY